MEYCGNQKAVDFLQLLLQSGRFPHALLLSGPEQVGKLTLGKLLAKTMIAGKADLKEAVGEVSAVAFVDPDLLLLEPLIVEKEKGLKKQAKLEIAQIREAIRELTLFPYQGKKRVLLINDAHQLTIAAQNALLKTLEEPADTAILILVTHQEASLLSTLKSRCVRINFSLLQNEALQNFKPGAEQSALTLAQGRPGELVKLLSDAEYFQARQALAQMLQNLPKQNTFERLQLAEQLAKDNFTALGILRLWQWLLRESYGQNFSAIGPLSAKIKLLDVAGEKLAKTNTNARLVWENLLLAF